MHHLHRFAASVARPSSGRIDLQRARRPFGIEAVGIEGRTVRVEQEDLLVLPFAVLTKFSVEGRTAPTILVVAPLAGGFPVLLRDLVVELLPLADVAVTDWLDARHVPMAQGRFGFADNVQAVASMIRRLEPGIDIIGVCQGVVPALLAAAQNTAEAPVGGPRALVLIGGPVDPLANPTHVVNLLRGRPLHWFEGAVTDIVPAEAAGRGRRVYPARLQLATLMGYLARHMTPQDDLFWRIICDDGADPLRYPFLRLCLQLMDLPFEFFIETVQHVYHEPSLRTGCAGVLGHKVELSALRGTPIMSIEGEQDDIVGPGQTQAVHDLCGGKRRSSAGVHLLVPGSGHFSLFYGAAWRRSVLPRVRTFLEACREAPASRRR